MVRDYGIVATLLALIIVLSVTTPTFRSVVNITNVLDQWAPVGIAAAGSTLVFIAGGFDLSIAAVFAVAGVVAASFADKVGTPTALIAGCSVGIIAGAINGSLVTLGRINAFIATLATSIIIEGFALAITHGELLPIKSLSFELLGTQKILDISLPVWLFAGTLLGLGIVLHWTTFGRRIFAVGGNSEAARLSGIRIGLIRWWTFVISGSAAAIGGLIIASRDSTGSGVVNMDITFNAIIAIVLGGTSILGGAGAIWRTLVGLMLLAITQNGFNLLGVDPVYQRIVYGVILLAAVGLDAWSRRS